MHVQWAIPCRYAEVAPGGATIVGAGADVCVFPTLPVPAQLNFIVRYAGSPEELETEHPISCRIFGPEGESLGEQTASLKAEGIQIVPGYAVEITVPTSIVLEVKTYGTYRLEFSIDGNPLDVPMHCIETMPQPPG